MRRLFIMRKDLHMSPGKLSAQVGHCAEAFWTNLLRRHIDTADDYIIIKWQDLFSKKIFDEYINGSFVKTICEAKSKTHLLKAKIIADDLGLYENEDYGLIYDNCLTELQAEEEDGTTLTGIWFKPLPDNVAHKISKKYQLYK